MELGYTLRIEQMDVNSWWACIYKDDKTIWDNNGSFQETEELTKKQVLKALNKHIDR